MAVSNARGVSPASYIAGGTIPQYALVKIDTSADGQAVVTAAATDVTMGVATQAAVSGQTVPIQMFGRCKAKASGSITRGDRLAWASGNKVATHPGNASTSKIVGIALVSAADGDLVEFEGSFPAENDTQ